MSAVSSWSLHRTLGQFVSGDGPDSTPGTGPSSTGTGVELLDLPAHLAAHGFDTLQLCHFHLLSRDAGYLADLRAALRDAGVTLDAVLIDDGDLTHPDLADAHQAWIAGWLETSAELGARRARVIAGRSEPTPKTLDDSARRLAQLAQGIGDGVRVVTENWYALTRGPSEVHHILDATGGSVGLLVDTGNWTGSTKYDELRSVAGRAETCHAKAHLGDAGGLVDYQKSLVALRDGGFQGPLALVFDDDGLSEWDGLEIERVITRSVFA